MLVYLVYFAALVGVWRLALWFERRDKRQRSEHESKDRSHIDE